MSEVDELLDQCKVNFETIEFFGTKTQLGICKAIPDGCVMINNKIFRIEEPMTPKEEA